MSPTRIACLLAALAAACSDAPPVFTASDASPQDDITGPAPECRLPEVLCGRRCVNPATDAQHCGGCGITCAQGQVCAAGRCDLSCPEGQFRCGARCVALATDRAHCGSCNNACPAGRVCSMGRCELACGPMYLACDPPRLDAGVASGDGGLALPTERYCTDPRTDELNCGGCGTVCPPGNLCEAGACSLSCARGLTRCGDTCADLQTSVTHCGACGTACAGAQRCVRGRCEGSPCPAGLTICGAACANLRTSPEHCGMCNNRCGDQSSCEAGQCVPNCRRGYTACGAVCAELTTDARHCGMCGRACPTGQACQGGACALVCPFDRAPCNGACVDTSTDPRNCGGCGTACAAGAICAGGVCGQSCAPDQTRCPDGRCVNLRVDPRNCGACGLACAPQHACVSGACAPLAGADAVACPAPSRLCGASCVDVASDNQHCGGCGRPCGPARVCVTGMCVEPCPLGQLRCGGRCVNGLSDASNCGACGRACPSGQSCLAGQCAPGLLPTRFAANFAPTGVAFVDACAAPGASRLLAMSDEGEALARTPFALRYFTVDVPAGSPVVVSANGWLGLDGLFYGGRSPFMPSSSAPNLVVAPHMGDQETTAPVCVATLGAAPSRRWVVEWSGTVERTSTAPIAGTALVYEVIVTEGANTIDFVHQTVTGSPSSRYRGLEGPGGLSTGSVSGCPGTTSFLCAAASGRLVRFSPAP